MDMVLIFSGVAGFALLVYLFYILFKGEKI